MMRFCSLAAIWYLFQLSSAQDQNRLFITAGIAAQYLQDVEIVNIDGGVESCPKPADFPM